MPTVDSIAQAMANHAKEPRQLRFGRNVVPSIAAALLLAGCSAMPERPSIETLQMMGLGCVPYNVPCYTPPRYAAPAHAPVYRPPPVQYAAPAPAYKPPAPAPSSSWSPITPAEAAPARPSQQPERPAITPEPVATRMPEPETPANLQPADTSCGWWRLCNIWN